MTKAHVGPTPRSGKEKKVALMELTCPLESNADQAHRRKTLKYTDLEISLTELGYQVYLTPFEIGSSGHINKRNKENIKATLSKFGIRLKVDTIKKLSKISLICTMAIFHAYQCQEWASPPLLRP